ncbi:MAG: glycosyl hydrolase-related protein, partial [Armatimonadota bacterium]
PPPRGGVQAPALQKTNFATLWENALLCSAHATQWLFQQDFDELDELITRTILQAQHARRSVLSAIARRVSQPENTAAIIFNSLPFERTEVVPVLATGPHGLPGPVKLVDGDGQEVPSQQVTPYEYPGRVWEADLVAQVTVPAMGYTTLKWEPTQVPAPGSDQMDNGLLKLSFTDEQVAGVDFAGSTLSGSIPWGSLRLYDVDTNGPLHCGPIRETMDAVFESGEIVESGPVRWRHAAQGKAGEHPLELETLLFKDQARIEFRLTCHWRGGDGFLAALWPTPIEGALETDVNFGAEIKDLDAIRYGKIEGHLSNNIERMRDGAFYARSFVSVSDGMRGVTHVSHDGDRYYIRDKAAGTIAHILINSVRPVQSGWEKHANYQRDALTRHTLNWSLVFHEGDWRVAGMARTAAALRQAPEVLAAHGAPDADLPAQHSFMSVEPANVALSAFYQDGEATLLRVWETEGRECEMMVQLPFAPLTAAVVDLNGDWLPDEAPPVVEGATLKLPLRPWQVATVQLRRNSAGEWPLR